MVPPLDNVRLARLNKLFNEVLLGKRLLNTPRDGKNFIEALCAQPHAPDCVHRIRSSPSGLIALQTAMRLDTSEKFMNEDVVRLLSYIQTPEMKAIGSGSVLYQILESIVEPPFFLDAYTTVFRDGLLCTESSRAYALLLLHLLSLPESPRPRHLTLAESSTIQSAIFKSSDAETRNIGQSIEQMLSLDLEIISATDSVDVSGPGGRHNNDSANIKEISIMPTQDELLSREPPFLRLSGYLNQFMIPAPSNEDASIFLELHKDNQFRLLREDMLGGIREELQKSAAGDSERHKGLLFQKLQLVSIDCGTETCWHPWAISLQCQGPLPQLKNVKSDHEKFLRKHTHILRHQNMACLFVDDEIVAFSTIHRDIQKLIATPASIVVEIDDASVKSAMIKLKMGEKIKLLQLDTATLSHEPFLRRLQKLKNMPLAQELLLWEEGQPLKSPSFKPTNVIENLREGNELQHLLGTKKRVISDEYEIRSLRASLSQRVSLVQRPPGTAKLIIGTLVAKALHDSTSEVILVVCCTNDALDNFCEDLLDIGISESVIVRFGGQSTDRIRPIKLEQGPRARFTPLQRNQINQAKVRIQKWKDQLEGAFSRFSSAKVQKCQLLDYLEFSVEELPFFETFSVPKSENGEVVIGKAGKRVTEFYLLDRWLRNEENPGAFQHIMPNGASKVWNMSQDARQSALSRWQNSILEDLAEEILTVGGRFNKDYAEIQRVLSEKDMAIIKSKRIIACTTTGAAKHFNSIQAAFPSVVLVEEAGEILESHILTALGPYTEQLIMIGDHQQLRPKCSYKLSVESGEGYDLNRSLFERLILKGFPHITLSEQHQMRPEISSIIRHLTYPHLTDAESTLRRKNLRGFWTNVMFINHTELETEVTESVEIREDAGHSKQNHFEACMILKCVRYLTQQGYGSENMVILTPYLGQLKLLCDMLAKDNDPVLNHLDRFDLLRSGLLKDLDSSESKPPLRISTIDNYQGQESDIVLVSLTRSNKYHDIGFMSAPERLNFFVSRARNALIMIGNVTTFMQSPKGAPTWSKFLDFLRSAKQIYEGFPTKCEQHSYQAALLSHPDDFDKRSPDGGCNLPCGAQLSCGLHICSSKCHSLSDHSGVLCKAAIQRQCPNGHVQTWKCHEGAPKICQACENAANVAQDEAQKAAAYQKRTDKTTKKHLKKAARINEAIAKLTRAEEGAKICFEQQTIATKDFESISEPRRPQPSGATPENTSGQSRESVSTVLQRSASQKSNLNNENNPQVALTSPLNHSQSKAGKEWQRQKDQEMAKNAAIDRIMEMIGLEEVKDQVLKIKAKVETSKRQGVDLRKERLGVVLLGNPGTGKTTVARHYAKVLASLDVLSGDGFVETTGFRLASGGAQEINQNVATLRKSGGGVYFIDEAYQLAETHAPDVKIVLDFLLAEIENQVGKVVFIFAGYRKQMEKFFDHNPRLLSRIPYTLHFEDYVDAELLEMLQHHVQKTFGGRMVVEDGMGGLYMRIAMRRLGRGRGREGFGNARALENLFSRIQERQADRLTKERRDGLCPNDYFLSKEDLIGPDPSTALLVCPAWEKLKKLTGLKAVKDSVSFMLDMIQTNYKRELQEKEPVAVSLNRVFLGSPGTGKTTVAKLYGQILAATGLLSNGEVVVKNPSDFVGKYFGHTEANTRAILENTIGKVLIIDEAYILYSKDDRNSFKNDVIDTLVAEIQSVPGDDRCVLLLGYEDDMVEMFQNVNPGLTRRFQLSDAFRFEDFTDVELEEILRMKFQDQDLGTTEMAISVAIGCLNRARNGLNFGNGGEVENLIGKAKANFQSRQSLLPVDQRSVDFIFEPEDFDPDYDRVLNAGTDLQHLFRGMTGFESIISKLDGYIKAANGMRAKGLDPRGHIPMNFVFKGPPGTGKTTAARKFGQVFYSLGFLSKVEVVEVSSSDLIAEYIGQTGPKTLKAFERGLGKVLFIDEAYRLAQGNFSQEAIDEIVDLMTKPKFAGKMVIILAGYDNDMNTLLRVNEGLSSRFTTDINFPALSPDQSLQVLEEALTENHVTFPTLKNPDVHEELRRYVLKLSRLKSWGNARDIRTLAKSMSAAVFQDIAAQDEAAVISEKKAFMCVRTMLKERQERADTSSESITE